MLRISRPDPGTMARSPNVQQCILFNGMSETQIEQVINKSRRASLCGGEILFEQHQPSKDFFLLDSGQIKLSLVSARGQEKIIDLVSAGNVFGESAVFSPQQLQPLTATALVDSEVLCFDTLTYANILQQSTDACFGLMELMNRRIQWQLTEIDRLTLHSATYRVLSYLLDHVSSTDVTVSTVRLDSSKNVLASRLSITPETLSRTLARLSRDGYISIVDDNKIRIDDIGRVLDYLQVT